MNKVFYLTSLAAVTLVSCSDNSFIGSEEAIHANNGEKPILFGTGATATSRATIEGKAAAELLNNHFVIEGIKGNGSPQTEVFDHYNVNYAEDTHNTTETNLKDWEYVGQAKHSLSAASQQTIKYWDYSASQYDFIAFSYGKADSTETTLSAIDYTKLGTANAVYTVTGSVEDLAKVYVADLITAYKADGDYQSVITPTFRQMGAKIRVAIYETVPGYSVKDLKFHTSDTRDVTPKATPVLYASSAVLPALDGDGVMSVSYPTVGASNVSETDYNKAHVSFANATADDLTSTLTFGALNYSGEEDSETAGDIYLGRTSVEATYAGNSTASYYEVILPAGVGTDLNLHVDYTLVPIDGAAETITVSSATALVPAIYTNWQPNYAYTYIFKISKNTNGTTGDPTTDPAGLYPIVFDAVVMDFGDGIQETITTVSDPSITTYAKGVEPTAAAEYSTGKNIYVSVDGASVELTADNAKLYTATIEDGAAQGIDEGTVANAIAQGDRDDDAKTYTVTDLNGKKLVVTDADGLDFATEIAADDSTDGNAVAGKFAVFAPAAAGNYVFEYNDGAKKHYKIIIVH